MCDAANVMQAATFQHHVLTTSCTFPSAGRFKFGKVGEVGNCFFFDDLRQEAPAAAVNDT